MSKTDKTRPLWVKQADHPGRTCVAHHDHRHGTCDLPPPALTAQGPLTGCTWEPTDATVYGRGFGCGCRQCTDALARRRARRAERAASRRECRDALRTVADWRDT